MQTILNQIESTGLLMNESKPSAAQLPPEVVCYLRGVSPEGKQFDFLIGEWDVIATRYKEDGSVLMQYNARWYAQYLNDGRMVMDDFKACLPTGQAISSYVTLRTYSEATRRWEMAGLSALQPAMPAEWHGVWAEEEMRIDAVGTGPEGKPFRNRIRFYNIEQDRFEWESMVSRDNGKTWTRAVEMIVTRAAPSTAAAQSDRG
jgi:hypothetical protein